MRSIRACVFGSIGWAEAIVGMSVSAAPSSSMFLSVIGQGLGTALQRRNRAGNESAMADLEETMRFDPEEGITNLDEHSPAGLVHLKNVIDINKCERLPDEADAGRIGRAAREIAHAEYGWDQLVTQLRPVVRL